MKNFTVSGPTGFGPFIEYDVEGEEKPKSLSLPEDIAPADVDIELIKILSQADKADAPLGIDPETNLPVYVKQGRFGPYLQLGDVTEAEPKPKRSPLPAGVTVETVELSIALKILSLPRDLGTHPEDGEPIRAAIGRYGPYVVHNRTFASLPKTTSVLDVELPEALELLAKKKQKGKGGAVLKDLGKHPEDGEAVVVMDGRYGPYVKHKRTNATLPETLKPDAVTLEQAVQLITEKNAKKGKKKGKK